MIIQPQSNLKLLANVPFTPEQTHQIMFASEAAQLQYMNAHVIAAFTNQSYVKKDDYIKLEVNPDAVYNCSYVMWQNVGFGNKWFYGFVTDIQYVSPECCGIRIQMDSYQSWLFQFTIGKSFVEREHVSDDSKGANTLPEGLETGPFVVDHENEFTMGLGTAVYSIPYDGEPAGSRVNNVYTGVDAQGYRSGNESALNTKLARYKDNPSLVANVMSCPDECMTGAVGQLRSYATSASLSAPTTINGYAPKNNKLFCYPYCFATIDNFSNQENTLRFELSGSKYGNIALSIFAYPNPKPGMVMYPQNYKGSETCIDEGITYTNFSVCAWSSDGFGQWLAFNGGANQLNAARGVISGVGTAIAGAAAGGVVGGVLGVAGGALSAYQSIYSANKEREYHQTTGGQLHGSVGEAAINAGLNKVGFRYRAMTIKAEYARIIDDYFTRFGYQVNRYKVPNLSSRTTFNFVKTVECFVNGNIPNDALREIASMFDKGVTLWHTTDVGNYSLANTIVEGGGEYE